MQKGSVQRKLIQILTLFEIITQVGMEMLKENFQDLFPHSKSSAPHFFPESKPEAPHESIVKMGFISFCAIVDFGKNLNICYKNFHMINANNEITFNEKLKFASELGQFKGSLEMVCEFMKQSQDDAKKQKATLSAMLQGDVKRRRTQ